MCPQKGSEPSDGAARSIVKLQEKAEDQHEPSIRLGTEGFPVPSFPAYSQSRRVVSIIDNCVEPPAFGKVFEELEESLAVALAPVLSAEPYFVQLHELLSLS